MKRRRSLPLFRAIEPDVYVIDTSAWLNIDCRTDAEDVWHLIGILIKQGRIVACAVVIEELRDSEIYTLRIKPFERALRAGDRSGNDIEYLRHVGKITYEHPAMSRARGLKTPADPYVIALAEIDDYIVVADETTSNSRNRKIPGVCQQRNIRCLTLDEFVSAARAALQK